MEVSVLGYMRREQCVRMRSTPDHHAPGQQTSNPNTPHGMVVQSLKRLRMQVLDNSAKKLKTEAGILEVQNMEATNS